jgi:hypothetical protein
MLVGEKPQVTDCLLCSFAILSRMPRNGGGATNKDKRWKMERRQIGFLRLLFACLQRYWNE